MRIVSGTAGRLDAMMEEEQTFRNRIAVLQVRAQELGFTGSDPDPKAAKQASNELWGEDDPALGFGLTEPEHADLVGFSAAF